MRTLIFCIVKNNTKETPTATTTHHNASHISELTSEKLRALRNITVSTHSRTTLANARIESIQSCPLVTICSTDFFIFFQILLKLLFVQIRNCVIIQQANIISTHSYIFSVFHSNPQKKYWNHPAKKKLIIIHSTTPIVIYLFLFFSTQKILSIENMSPIMIAASSVSLNVTINIAMFIYKKNIF